MHTHTHPVHVILAKLCLQSAYTVATEISTSSIESKNQRKSGLAWTSGGHLVQPYTQGKIITLNHPSQLALKNFWAGDRHYT